MRKVVVEGERRWLKGQMRKSTYANQEGLASYLYSAWQRAVLGDGLEQSEVVAIGS
jgi:hypothetical protein